MTSKVWPVIKLDLDYVSTYWNQSTYVWELPFCNHMLIVFCFSFDLWEEVNSKSFFTTAVQHRSLREGIALATKLGQTSVVSGYTAQADNLLCFLQVSTHLAGIRLSLNVFDSPTGTPLVLTLHLTLEEVVLERIQTLFWRLSTHSILPLDAMPLHSNHAQIRHCQT